MKRVNLSIQESLLNEVQEYRRKQTPIPSRNQAILDLIKKGLKQ